MHKQASFLFAGGVPSAVRRKYHFANAYNRQEAAVLTHVGQMLMSPKSLIKEAMHKSRLAALVIDSKVDELPAAAGFWGNALGLTPVLGDDKTSEKYVHLQVMPSDVLVLVQKVEHTSLVHLNIETDDIRAEVLRLERLGATVVNEMEKWTVMQAPTGHRFCVVGPQRPDFHEAPNTNTWV